MNHMVTHKTNDRSWEKHEPNVVNAGTIWWCGLALVAIIVAAGVIIQALSSIFAGKLPRAADVAAEKRAAPPFSPGGPQLTPNQQAALAQLRAHERTRMNEFAWVDRQQGVARVPIARAIEIVAKSGLPPVVVAPSDKKGSNHE
jgi:hypothetical protein